MENKKKTDAVESADSDNDNAEDFEKPFDEVINQAMF